MTGKNKFQEEYELLEKIGKGGMGVVHKARQISLNRLVAVKMLAPEFVGDEEFIHRLTREAHVIARMRNHENIVEVYDFIETDENFYIVMEYVEGESLSQVLKRKDRLSPAESAEILARIAHALHHAHKAGVIHRDIKPENILIDKRGRLKVMDFGLAHLFDTTHKTRTGAVLGTPHYMAPEQAQGKTVDARSDIYSMGVLLYRCVTGTLPFTGDSPIAIAMKHVNEAPPLPRSIVPSIPEKLEKGILKALEKDPANRFQTAKEFAEFLEDPEFKVLLSRPPGDPSFHSAPTLIGTIPPPAPSSLDKILEKTERQRQETERQRQEAEARRQREAEQEAENKRRFQIEYAKYQQIRQSAYASDEQKSEAWKTLCADWGIPVDASLSSDLIYENGKARPILAVDLGSGVTMELVYIPAGSFRMGSRDSEQGRGNDEDPVHTVKLDGFWMGKYEVTFEQYKAATGSSHLGDHHFRTEPVVLVSWNDATGFCRKLTDKVGRASPPATVGRTFRLPTEAEWEYACRAGSKTRFCFGNSEGELGDYAWYEANSGNKTHPVGEKKPNAWGLYDMHGNVEEWCGDRYGEKYYGESDRKNPQGPASGKYRVLRGGTGYFHPQHCRSAYRSRRLPSYENFLIGFRVVCVSRTQS